MITRIFSLPHPTLQCCVVLLDRLINFEFLSIGVLISLIQNIISLLFGFIISPFDLLLMCLFSFDGHDVPPSLEHSVDEGLLKEIFHAFLVQLIPRIALFLVELDCQLQLSGSLPYKP